MLKLCAEEGGLHRIESSVVSLDIVVILLGLTMIPDHFAGVRQLRIVRCNRATFSASAQIFARIKAECGRASHRTSPEPAVLLAREVLGAVRLAGIFDNDQAILLG